MDNRKERVALVTGASTGIGRATAIAFRNANFQVFGTTRKLEPQLLDGVTMMTCDVTSDASVAALAAAVLDRAGRIDVLVNNAGVGLLAAVEESSILQAKALFDVNLFGVMRMTNAVLPAMRARQQGRIVNLSSVLGFIPAPYSALYAATKHAVEGYSESLDHETRSFGVRVALVEPAYTATAFGENLTAPDNPLAHYAAARTNVLSLMAQIMETADTPETVAETVLKAATTRQPKPRYTAGKTARQVSFLRRFVPTSLFDKSLRRQLQLND